MWEKFKNLDSVTKIVIIIIIIIILYVIILYFSSNQDKEQYTNNKKQNYLLDLYYSPTCGHCIQFKTEWNKLIKTNAYKCSDHNCASGECAKDIEFVPTLKINGTIYTGDMNANAIITHINSMK